MVKGLLLALAGWLIIMLVSYYVIGVYFTTPEMKEERIEEYIESLQNYVTERRIDEDNAGKIANWVRDNPYVYVLAYYSKASDTELNEGSPDTDNKPSELMGSRIDDTLERDQLVSDAVAGGYHKIELIDGSSVTVAIAEYTENLYYVTFNIISVAVAMVVFVLSLVRYIRIIIERIKRFESDVTIVSEIDMSYEIVSEGEDEIATLSSKVEQMRRTMLDHVRSEQEARETNAELIASISHDIRTPLTVLMGYIEMMKERDCSDDVMEGYISATESTALRLKQLADDMFKYSLAFGDTEKTVTLDKYDATTLFDQLLSEHILLMRELGYDIRLERLGEGIKQGSVVRTDAPNLMRIIDNVFSNLRKYADINKPILFTVEVADGRMRLECRNTIRTDTEDAESNGIGLKTCVRLASLVAERFEYSVSGDEFICRLTIAISEGQKQ